MDIGKGFFTGLVIRLCVVFIPIFLGFDLSHAGKEERTAGRTIHHQMWGPAITPKIAALASATDRQIGLSFEELYGRICTDSVLDNKMRSICTVSCLAAQGLFPEAKIHMAAALHLGWKPNQIRETLLQLTYVAGFPVAIEAIKILNGLLDQLSIAEKPLSLEDVWNLKSSMEKHDNKQEKKDEDNKALAIESMVPGQGFDEMDWVATGNAIGSRIYGKKAWEEIKFKAKGFSPNGSDTLMEAIFGQIMARPVIDAETRSMCLITSLLARNDMRALKGAISGAFEHGCDSKKINALIYQMTMYVGWPTCLNALSVCEEVKSTGIPKK